MATARPGRVSVEDIFTGVSANIGDKLQKRDWLVHMHSESKTRVRTATSIANGEWYTVWPNLSQTAEAPTVANIVEMGINHWASIFGAILPSVRVPVNASQDRSQAKRGARKRERRLRELWKSSNWSELAAQGGADYAGAGFTIAGVWANFGERDLKKRHPYVMHFDPRTTFVLKDNLGNITEMLVARRLPEHELARHLKEEYPTLYNQLKDRGDEVEEWFWYDQETFMHVILDVTKEGRDAARWVVLTNEENKLGFVPAWEAVRPTFDGERRGIFDQTIHILRTMHRMMIMTIQSTEENAFPAIGVYDVQNPKDFGPGAIIRYRSPDSKVDRLGPAQHFDIKDLISRLTDEAMRYATYPQQLIGEPGGSIVSGRGVKASMGALDARLALAHKQFELMYSKLSGFMLAMDEVYCDGEKQILGDETDDAKAEGFLPSRDIAGAWTVACTYGIGAGSDPANIEIRLQMHIEGGLISKETAREQIPFLEDPDAERLKIFRENMHLAIQDSALQQAAAADPAMAAHALKLMQADDMDFDDIIDALVEFILQPQEDPAAAGGSPAAGVLQGAESMARGGMPGGGPAAGGGGPPGLSLPPLGDIMQQDSRQGPQ